MTLHSALPERFQRRVTVQDDGCWSWDTTNSIGYGEFMQNRVGYYAHRFAYEAMVGPIPEGLVIDHLCRNRRCVNPAHMEPVTRGENVLRGISVPAQNARKTHCSRGHAYDEANTHITPRGSRSCRACWRIDNAQRRARQATEAAA